MLVLTRRKDEAIHIGDDVRIVVVCVERGKVKLGIEAPIAVRILRQELIFDPEENVSEAPSPAA